MNLHRNATPLLGSADAGAAPMVVAVPQGASHKAVSCPVDHENGHSHDMEVDLDPVRTCVFFDSLSSSLA